MKILLFFDRAIHFPCPSPPHPGIWTTITMAAKYIGAILEIHLDAAIGESFNPI
ncbi:hypothetical protein [Delftia acidovorans]|uniref:hypothetical protein n=1 Tax=Delftia acidovorans TaxID=80866 RepID=UPI001BAFE7DA|nr:hypothetical protein [Delftia acidovorans]